MNYAKLAFLLLLCCTFFSARAQRGVLLEKYTSAWCGLCPDAHLRVQALTETYPSLIPVYHHSSVDGMGNPFSSEWFQGFQVPGTPRGMVDRNGGQAGDIAVLPQQWEARIQQRLAEPPAVDLTLHGLYHAGERRLELDIATAILEAPPEGHLRLNVMILEDSVTGSGPGWDQSSYFNESAGHPLEGLGNPLYNYPHRHVLRAVLDGTWGTTDAYPGVIEPGQDFQHTYEYVIPEAYRADQIRVVAFVSLFHPTDLTRREVLNARALNLTDMDLVSSREDLAKEEDWQLFPNPAKREVFIRFPESAAPFEGTVSLFNAAGRPLYTAPSLPAGRRIDLGPYPPGLYLIRLDTRAGTSVRKLVIHP